MIILVQNDEYFGKCYEYYGANAVTGRGLLNRCNRQERGIQMLLNSLVGFRNPFFIETKRNIYH